MKLHMPHFSGRLICISDSGMFSAETKYKDFMPVTKIVVEEKVIKMVTRPHDSIIQRLYASHKNSCRRESFQNGY
jgi:hypothetical protein